jgi:hypothetical protein
MKKQLRVLDLKQRRARLAELEATLLAQSATEQEHVESLSEEQAAADFIEHLVCLRTPQPIILESILSCALRKLRELVIYASETNLSASDPDVKEALQAFRRVIVLCFRSSTIHNFLTRSNMACIDELARLTVYRLRQELATHQSLYIAALQCAQEVFSSCNPTIDAFSAPQEDEKLAHLRAILQVWDSPELETDAARIAAWMNLGGPVAHALASAWARSAPAPAATAKRSSS